MGRKAIELPDSIISEYLAGSSGLEIADKHGVSFTTIYKALRAAKVKIHQRGRGKGLANFHARKISDYRRAWLLRQDAKDVPHADLARKLGITRERVRQICAEHLMPPRHLRLHKMQDRRETKQARAMRRAMRIAWLSRAWIEGMSCLELDEIAGTGNRSPSSLKGSTRVSNWRIRYGKEWFPYRQPRKT